MQPDTQKSATRPNKGLSEAPAQGVLDASALPRLQNGRGRFSFETIHYVGNLDLLKDRAIGFCGSRDVSPKGQDLAADCARQAVKKGLVVVSGYARGVDSIVHATALEKGGRTIAVLPEGIENFRIRRDLKKYWDWERVLVLSHFKPESGWQVYRAMERNGLIVQLADAMVVIEARDKGGTIRAGEESLKRGIALYVSVYEDEACEASSGNRLLLKQGAKPLRKSRERDCAEMSHIFKTIENDATDSNFTQLPLFSKTRRAS